MATEGLIQLTDVRVKLRDFDLVIDNFSLRKPITIVSGANGAGKSTFFRLLLGIVNANEGHVNKPEHIQLGYVPQSYRSCLFPWLTLKENLLAHKHVNEDVVETQLTLLEKMGMSAAYQHKKPRELSGGQCQRVALVRELTIGSQVVILDEPFASLDKKSVPKAESVIMEYIEKGGHVIITSHTDFSVLDSDKTMHINIERESDALSRLSEVA